MRKLANSFFPKFKGDTFRAAILVDGQAVAPAPVPPTASEQRGWHGTRIESLWGILDKGELLASVGPDDGGPTRTLQDKQGELMEAVFLHKDTEIGVCAGYWCWQNFVQNGTWFSFVFEVKYDPRTKKHKKTKNKQVPVPPSGCQLVALWCRIATSWDMLSVHWENVYYRYWPHYEVNPGPDARSKKNPGYMPQRRGEYLELLPDFGPPMTMPEYDGRAITTDGEVAGAGAVRHESVPLPYYDGQESEASDAEPSHVRPMG